MKIEPGKVLQNRYLVIKQIGEGGMGTVYIATDRRFDSTVAIKQTLYGDGNMRKAFEREARLLNSLRHPALPKVTDHFTEDDGQFLVMEYIAGDDLADLMEKRGTPFPVKDVLAWADQLLDALEYLHSQAMPVIHRDIKPQNLKLTKNGQIVLLDFGLAKGNATDPSSTTSAKSVFGFSPVYASLEQMQGTGTDPRSDIYSLAATLYHLVTGKMPPAALTRATAVLNGEKDPLPLVQDVRPEAPAYLSDTLHQSLALNSNHRPATAAIMRRALKNELQTQANQPDTVADLSPFISPHDQKTEVIELDQDAIMTQTKPGAIKIGDVPTEILPSDVVTEVSTPKITVDTADVKSETTKLKTYAAPETSGSHGKTWAIAAAAVVLLGGGGTAAWYALNQQSANSNKIENKPANVQVNTQPTPNEAVVSVGNGGSVFIKTDPNSNKQTLTVKSSNKPETTVIETRKQDTPEKTVVDEPKPKPSVETKPEPKPTVMEQKPVPTVEPPPRPTGDSTDRPPPRPNPNEDPRQPDIRQQREEMQRRRMEELQRRREEQRRMEEQRRQNQQNYPPLRRPRNFPNRRP
jgi:serine/threonine protein kinase